MPTLDEHSNTITIIGMMIVLIAGGIQSLDSRVSSEWRIGYGLLMVLAGWTLWRAVLKARKAR